MIKNIVIDDYGRTPKVSKNILNVINDVPIIYEVSVMVGFVKISIHEELKKQKIQTSLHLNLTDNISIENIDKNLNFIDLLFLSKKKRKFVYKEIDRQIKIYQKLYNLKYIKVNGHEHVHAIPWIYKYLYKNKNIKSIRYSDEIFLYILKKINYLDFIKNFCAFIILKILSIFNKRKTNKLFFGVLYTNNMCQKNYQKITKKYGDSNLEILFHPGKASKSEIHYFSNKSYYTYYRSHNRLNELKELYEIKKNISNY